MTQSIQQDKFYIVGNNLAIDFANSIDWDLTLENLLSWVVGVKMADEETAIGLLPKWKSLDIRCVRRFRDSLRAMLVNVSNGGKLKPDDIEKLNSVLRERANFSQLSISENRYVRNVELDLSEPRLLLVPIVETFVDLLCFANLALLRKCENDDCYLYFYDTSKNHSRRWCSMAHCGNIIKAAKFYENKRKNTL